jgi:hypothetical protein
MPFGSQEDLDKTILAIAEALKKREKLARGKVPEVPLLPESNGEVEKAADETPNAVGEKLAPVVQNMTNPAGIVD